MGNFSVQAIRTFGEKLDHRDFYEKVLVKMFRKQIIKPIKENILFQRWQRNNLSKGASLIMSANYIRTCHEWIKKNVITSQ